MASSISVAKHGLLSAGRNWRLSRVSGGISRRNGMDSTVDSSVVSPAVSHCSTTDSVAEIF